MVIEKTSSHDKMLADPLFIPKPFVRAYTGACEVSHFRRRARKRHDPSNFDGRACPILVTSITQHKDGAGTYGMFCIPDRWSRRSNDPWNLVALCVRV